MTRPDGPHRVVSRVRVKPSVLARPVGEQLVLLDLESGCYFSLNAVGAFIWHQLERGETSTAIVERIVAEYEVATAQAAADLDALLSDLIGHGLVTASDER